ncbi:MAG: DNA polymerase I [Alphaproteobacteria bacterium]|nr:DNA polymerase I [Alphaproteobacteria bacterium]
MKKAPLYLIDVSGFIFRAYFALARSQGGLTNSEGTPVGAVLGFTNMMVKLLQERKPEHIGMVFDTSRQTFRSDIYKEYKAHRDAPPEDLVPQFPIIREATEAFGFQPLELAGFEADDIIATYTRLAKEKGQEVIIVSSDKDLMQLVGEGVTMFDPMKNVMNGEAEVFEKFGVQPNRVIDVQSLAGDAADNVPGVPGIGIKTAALLINEYGDLDTLLERASEIKQPKRRESLIENAEMARISRQLVTLDQHVALPVSVDDLPIGDPLSDKLTAFLEKQGFRSIAKRLGKEIKTPQVPLRAPANDSSTEIAVLEHNFPDISKNKYTLIDDEKTLITWLEKAKAKGILAVDTETTGLTPAKADLVGVCISYEVGEAAYIPLTHKSGEVDLFGGGGEDLKQIPFDRAIEILKPYLEDPSILKIGQNIKYDWQFFAKHGVEMVAMDDTMLLSYVLDGGSHSHGMDALSKMYLDHTPISYKEVCGTGKSQITFDYVPLDKALDYAAEDADVTLRLYYFLKERLVAEKMVQIYEEIERPLIPVIAQMELDGIKVDPLILNGMSVRFGKKIDILEKEIFLLAGNEFNVKSPKQLGKILFEDLGLEGGKKTKTGDWSTSVDVLEKLSTQGHEIVTKVLEYRQMTKLKSTYTDALQNEINPKTGRVHTSYHMTGTSTGRLSSSDPNLQNIPIRTEDGRAIRTAFIAEQGHTLLAVDYSQIELRLIAEVADIPRLKEAFINGEDIHARTASEVFGVPLEGMPAEIRRKAKAINFGIIYGISAWGLAKQLDISPSEAKDYIQLYFARFPEIADYMEEYKQKARDNLYVETLYGRKCFTDGINDKNGARRAFAERIAINAPIQGTAADIIKLAMSKMPRELKANNLSAKMLLQVHDELIFEVPNSELEQTSKLVAEVMESVVKLSLPLTAEAGTGQNWAEAH